MRHTKKKHKSHKIVSSILNDIISSVVAENAVVAEIIVSSLIDHIVSKVVDDQVTAEERDDGSAKIFPYERARINRVAMIRAEFEVQFPSFWEGVKDTRVVPKEKILKIKRREVFKNPERKSSRVLEQESAVIVTGAGDNAPLVRNGADITEGDLGFNVTDNGAGVADNDAGVADSVARALGKFACLACKMPFR